MGVSNWQQAVKLWSDERGAYNWRSATFQSNAGHLCAILLPAAHHTACCFAGALSTTQHVTFPSPVKQTTSQFRSRHWQAPLHSNSPPLTRPAG